MYYTRFNERGEVIAVAGKFFLKSEISHSGISTLGCMNVVCIKELSAFEISENGW